MPVTPPRITITPETVTLEPGVTVTLAAEIFNTSDIVEEFSLDVVGTGQRFSATVTPAKVDLFPGESQTVELSVDVRTLYAASAGPHRIGVRAIPVTSAESSRVEEVTIEVLPVSELLLEVHPQMARVGRAGAFVLVARNRGNSHIEALITGSDPEGMVQFGFDPPQLVIPPGEEVYSVVEARGRRPIIGQDAQRSLTFRTIGPDPEAPEILVDAVMLQRAWLASIFSTILVMVIAAVLFAAAFLIVERMK